MNIRFRPLTTWPGDRTLPGNRRKGSFSMSFPNVLKSLEREMKHLAAADVVIEAAVNERQIRQDGWLYAGASASEPGIVLSFNSKFGPLRMPCDYFRDWQSNLRAVALHLENLRHASLYGVGRFGEQYRGWNALPAAIKLSMTVEEAARTMVKFTGDHANGDDVKVVADKTIYRAAWRAAADRYHPDHNNGDVLQEWHTLQSAKEVLDRHHGV